jgi:cephalosporin hydroxylase
MKLILDTDARTVTIEEGGRSRSCSLYGTEAFAWLSREWLRLGWQLKYSYQFSWLGRPIIQLPEDLLRLQQVLYRLRPDMIVETGVAHGGSLIFYASMCQLLGKGRVIGVDLTIHPHNRQAIERHELAHRITLVEGDSVDPAVVAQVAAFIRPGETVLVLLDSNHSREHVVKELDAYSGLVSVGSYLVATDGVMKELADLPSGQPNWAWDNPSAAAQHFLRHHPEFVHEEPAGPFRETAIDMPITYWPGGWLRRVAAAVAAA